MSTLYLTYPQNSGGAGSTGSVTGVPYVVGPLDGAALNAQGGTIGSYTFYQQSAGPTFPGLVSSTSQTFRGVKTFLDGVSVASVVSSGSIQANSLLSTTTVIGANLQASADVTAGGSVIASSSVQGLTGTFTALTGGAPVRSGASGLLVNGSTSLANEVTGLLPSSMVLGSITGDVYLVGALDGAASNNLGATIGSFTFYQQSATASVPGVVSSGNQTFAGVKTFSGRILAPSGTVGVPGLAFSVASTTGLYAVGSADFSFSVGGVQAIGVVKSAGGFGNIGMGGAASLSDLFPFSISRTQDGGFLTQALSNISSVAGSGGRLQALVDNGANSAEVIATSVNTAAPDVYAAGRAVFRSAGNMTGINFLCGATDGTTKFYVGGNGTVGEVSATVNSGGFFAKTVVGAPFHRIGSVSMTCSVGGATYQVTWPGAQGGAGTTNINDGAGNFSWQSVLVNPTTTSGDMIISSASGTLIRLALVGSAGMSLVKDTNVSYGVSWGVPSFQIYDKTDSAGISKQEQVVYWGGGGGGSGACPLPDPILNNGARVLVTVANTISSTISFAVSTTGSASIVSGGVSSASFIVFSRGETVDLLAVASTNMWLAVNHSASTGWIPFVPTNTQGLGSLTATSFIWRRDGPDMLIMGAGTSGTTTASEAQFGLPEGVAIDSVVGSGSFLAGPFSIAGNGVQYPTVIGEANQTFLNFGSQNSATSSLVKQPGSTVIGNTTRFSLNVRIPIRRWRA